MLVMSQSDSNFSVSPGLNPQVQVSKDFETTLNKGIKVNVAFAENCQFVTCVLC